MTKLQIERKLTRIIDLRNEQVLLLRDLRKRVQSELRRVNALGAKATELLDSIDAPDLEDYPTSFADALDDCDALPIGEDHAAELLLSEDELATPPIAKTVRAVFARAAKE